MTTPPTHNLRVLFCSDHPDATSGYSVQTKLAALRLKEHCHLALLATFGLHGSIQDWNGVPLFPGGADAFANDVIPKAARAWQADVIITLKDALVFNPATFNGFRWCVPGHTLVTLADGREIDIKTLVEDRLPVKVKAWDGVRTVSADILDYQCIRSNVAGTIIEIETESGERLEVTAENEVLVLRNSALQWIKAACVVRGDVVYCNSSRSLNNGGQHGTTQGNGRDGSSTNAGTSTTAHDSGMGVHSGHIRRGGDDLDHSSSETRPLFIGGAFVRDEHERTADGLARPEDRYAYQWPQSPERGAAPPFHSRDKNQLSSFDTWLQGIPHSKEHLPVSDRQEGTERDRNGVHGEQSATALQWPIYSERDRFVAPCEGFEPRWVSSVRYPGRPYPFVYDITTTAGNFVAGGILIHNCPMTPIDHDPSTPQVIERVRQSYRPIAYAPHGFRALRRAGLDPAYVPHAYDPKVYYPMDKAESRALFKLPDDLFIVGTVAVNRGGLPSRKSWVENLEAFAIFAHDKPNVRLFVHTDLADEGYEGGIPLRPVMANLGILDKVLYCDQERYRYGGFAPEYMRHFYNSIDVLNAVSMGEGFGIPALEAQAVGTPVIVGDWCAHEDLCFAGWKVAKEEAHHFYDQQQGYVFIPKPHAIADRMSAAYHQWRYERENTYPDMHDRAIAGATPYQIDTVIRDHWLPLLAELERDIRNPKSRGVLRIIRREEVFRGF